MKKFWYVIHYLIGKRLPASTGIGGRILSKIRAFCAKRFSSDIGKNVNIDTNATIYRDLILGDNTGIGKGPIIAGGVSIGKDVMMGPECYIYTRNHSFSSTDEPMRLQGYEEGKPVVTKDVPQYAVVGGNPAKILKFRNRSSEK